MALTQYDSMFGTNVLHQLIAKKKWPAVVDRCRSHPEEAQKLAICDFLYDGFKQSKATPLHNACALNATNEVVVALLIAFEQAIGAMETAYQRLPLHTALHNCSTRDVLLTLINCCPKAISKVDDLGRLPLHYAIANGASMGVILKLLSLNESTARVCDLNGWNALHVACVVGAPVILVKRLLRANPDGILDLSIAGSTPLEFARSHANTKIDVISVLEQAVANALRKEITPPQGSTYTKSKKFLKKNKKLQLKCRTGVLV